MPPQHPHHARRAMHMYVSSAFFGWWCDCVLHPCLVGEMGLLTVGTPLSWEDVTKEMCDHVRRNGAVQYVHQFRKHKAQEETRAPRHLKWGEEIEYTIFKEDPANKRMQLSLRAPELLEVLNREYPEQSVCSTLVAWHPEYSNWMLEGTPGQPYGNMIIDLLAVEANMGLRRRCPANLWEENEFMLSVTAFPRLGCEDALDNPQGFAVNGAAARSEFIPDEVMNPHPRFPTLTANIRKRRGDKVCVYRSRREACSKGNDRPSTSVARGNWVLPAPPPSSTSRRE